METRYTQDHEWVALDGDRAMVGITDHAQKALGDIVYVELPEVGRTVKLGDPFAVVESVKAASDVFAPLSGEVLDTNGELPDAPQTLNEAPESTGWMVRLRISNPAEFETLMDRAKYEQYVAGLDTPDYRQ